MITVQSKDTRQGEEMADAINPGIYEEQRPGREVREAFVANI